MTCWAKIQHPQMWQSGVIILLHISISLPHSKHWTSVKGGARMRCVDASGIHASMQPVWDQPLTNRSSALQHFKWSNTIKTSNGLKLISTWDCHKCDPLTENLAHSAMHPFDLPGNYYRVWPFLCSLWAAWLVYRELARCWCDLCENLTECSHVARGCHIKLQWAMHIEKSTIQIASVSLSVFGSWGKAEALQDASIWCCFDFN